jgi:hypothetical protein
MAAGLATCQGASQLTVDEVGSEIKKLCAAPERMFSGRIHSALLKIISNRIGQLAHDFLNCSLAQSQFTRDVEVAYIQACNNHLQLSDLLPVDLSRATVAEMRCLLGTWGDFLTQWPRMWHEALTLRHEMCT